MHRLKTNRVRARNNRQSNSIIVRVRIIIRDRMCNMFPPKSTHRDRRRVETTSRPPNVKGMVNNKDNTVTRHRDNTTIMDTEITDILYAQWLTLSMFLEHVPILKMSYFWPQIASNPLHHTHCTGAGPVILFFIAPSQCINCTSLDHICFFRILCPLPIFVNLDYFQFHSVSYSVDFCHFSCCVLFSPISMTNSMPFYLFFASKQGTFTFCLSAHLWHVVVTIIIIQLLFTLSVLLFFASRSRLFFGSGNCPFYEYLNCLLCSRKCVEDIGEPSFDLYHFSIVACCEWPNCCAYARDALVVCRLTISGNWSMCMLFCWLDLICPHAIGDNAFFVCILFDLL